MFQKQIMEKEKKKSDKTYFWCLNGVLVVKNIFTYNRYSSICANIVRKCLNKNKRVEAEKREIISNWENGKQGKSETLTK
ncbi:hypothetical protein PNEG_04295 [Pneumocystis murina B123]|uniref:Uncharacterized protein n=1 Tax=Pneumocystis murina (strain B123) TaxID=1069680 RepID=A0A0W4ZX01_PNEMU|nr:hypothetical protein PNEG_04295 [Pneumocystis murina B123]KTW32891.1 hypothetical protein PNEG_04295 [Pneumocystis murina B123]